MGRHHRHRHLHTGKDVFAAEAGSGWRSASPTCSHSPMPRASPPTISLARCALDNWRSEETPIHHLPFKLVSYFSRIRLTPSVTCFDDSVAPLIFLMSAFNCSGELTLLPTNCARHAASRTSYPYDSL